MLDLTKLTKLLMLTTSEHDGEALSAIRKANELLDSQRLRWSEVFTTTIGTTATASTGRPSAGAEYHSRGTNWAKLIDSILCRSPRMSDASRSFLTSVREFFEQRGYLTDKQEAAVRKYMR